MGRILRLICLESAIALAVLAAILPARSQDDAAPKLRIDLNDGSVVELPYLRFDIADGAAVFADDDGGELLVPVTELTLESMAAITAMAPPLAGWLDPKKADLCVRAAGSNEQKHEEEAAQVIHDAAKLAANDKEQLALIQLHGIVHGLLKADHDRVRMEEDVKQTREAMDRKYKLDLEYANRHAINPLTGRDQKTPHMEWSMSQIRPALQGCIEREQASKRALMLRLASCNLYARYCEISGRAAYAKELEGLRQKIAERSPVSRDSEQAGVAIIAWMAGRISIHHHAGTNAVLLKRTFEKLQRDDLVNAAIKIILFERPPEDCFKVRAALLAFTEQKLTQDQMGDLVVDIRLRHALREIIPNLGQRNKAIEQLKPFLQEAIRMGSR